MIPFAAPRRPVNRVFLHCSASDRPEHDDVSVIDRWHRDRGFDGCGYHFYLTKGGVIQPGRSLEKTPAAQEGHNTGAVAICLGGLAKDRFTSAQFASLRLLCRAIRDAIPGVTFHGHREVSAKECPVYDYRAVLGLDAHGRMP